MNNAPIREPAGDIWSPAWTLWFTSVVQCLPWGKAFTAVATIDFPSVAAFSESASAAVTVKGARQGDSVEITPYANQPGLIFTGVVTANDQVTIYAKNFTNGAKDPGSTQYRIIVKQN